MNLGYLWRFPQSIKINELLFCLIGFSLSVVWSTLPSINVLDVFMIKSDFTLIFLGYYTVFYVNKRSAFYGYACGFVKDILTGSPLGLFALTYFFACYCLERCNRTHHSAAFFQNALIVALFYIIPYYLLVHPSHLGLQQAMISHIVTYSYFNVADPYIGQFSVIYSYVVSDGETCVEKGKVLKGHNRHSRRIRAFRRKAMICGKGILAIIEITK